MRRPSLLFWLDFFALWAGAFCVTLALDYGLGMDFGWWGALFWLGIGLLYVGFKD